ncbi:MAG: hypothetical protein ABIN96_16850 [Rubrivivax sp.]
MQQVTTLESPLSRPVRRPRGVMAQACADGSCGTDAAEDGEASSAYPFVYAIGNIEIRFPSLGVEKEFVQASGRADAAGLTDQQMLHSVLTLPQNRYLTRQLCWVMTIEGLDTYLLQPREAADFDLLLGAVRANPGRLDLDVVIGLRGPLAPPSLCNGLTVPIVGVSQIYSFDRDSFVKAVPVPEGIKAAAFSPAVRELFDRFLKVADNAGATDEHRAINYMATRYPAVFNLAADRMSAGFGLDAIETSSSRLSGARRMVNVNFVFVHRQTNVPERYSVRVDVTEEFPFLSSTLSPAPYFER